MKTGLPPSMIAIDRPAFMSAASSAIDAPPAGAPSQAVLSLSRRRCRAPVHRAHERGQPPATTPAMTADRPARRGISGDRRDPAPSVVGPSGAGARRLRLPPDPQQTVHAPPGGSDGGLVACHRRNRLDDTADSSRRWACRYGGARRSPSYSEPSQGQTPGSPSRARRSRPPSRAGKRHGCPGRRPDGHHRRHPIDATWLPASWRGATAVDRGATAT